MKKTFLPILILPLFLQSCEKEIPLDYREVDQLYVAEACMTQDETRLRLSTTQNITDNDISGHIVEDAVAVLSCEGEVLDTLRYIGSGMYYSRARGRGTQTYTLDIETDGRHFTSTSTMQHAPQPVSFRFLWKKMLGRRYLFAELKLQDLPGEVNCYFMHIYRNGLGYRWAVLSDEHGPGQELQQLFHCCMEDDIRDGKSDALAENTDVTVEIRSIDRRAYDYFYSMQTMESAGTNPVRNFTGGCLGYFSAFYAVKLNQTFHLSDVEEE